MNAVAERNGKATKTKVRPLKDQVLVRRVEAPKMTSGGIALPEETAEKLRPLWGVVLAVGPGPRSQLDGERIPLDVEEGDRVVFAPYAGSETTIDEEDLHLLSEKDILAVLS